MFASGHLYGQEVLLLDRECPDVPNLEETGCVVAGRVRKPHRALGAHRNVRVSQQVRRRKTSAHSICQDVVHAGVSKLLREHTLSFVFTENQLQKMFRDGSAMMKPLLCTIRDALCTLTSSTCAEKKRSLPETLIHGSARKSRNYAGKDCTFGGRTWNATDEGRTSVMLLGVFSRFIYGHSNVFPLWVPRDHFKFHDVVLSILGYRRGQYVHIHGRFPCQAYIPARRRANKNRQRS